MLRISFEKMCSKIFSLREKECDGLHPVIYRITLSFSLLILLAIWKKWKLEKRERVYHFNFRLKRK